MATKRARAYTFETVRKAFEELLEDGEAVMGEHIKKPGGGKYKLFAAQQAGIYQAATKLGLKCTCSIKEKRKKCLCKKSGKGIRKGHLEILSLGHGAFTFDGTRCRDAQGAFVPVAQCRGRVVGRDKKGKFVSMKG